MGDFAIVTCMKNVETEVKKTNLVQQLYSFIQNFFKHQKIEETLVQQITKVVLFEPEALGQKDEVQTNDSINLHSIVLPFQLDELENINAGRVARVEQFIKNYCAQNKIGQVFLPEIISSKCRFKDFAVSSYKGRYLYQALFTNIIEDIYTKRGIKIRELDIAIVQGESREVLLSYVMLLAPMVKYLTVISEDKEEVEKQAEEIYEETGLSVRVTNDYKTGLKSADFILNLGTLTQGMKINPRAVILNYGDIGCSKAVSDNLVINGIEVKLPSKMASRLENNIFNYFNHLELSEMMIFHKLGMDNEIDFQAFLTENRGKICGEFASQAYSITGYVGRRNTLKSRDIKVPSRLMEASSD